MAEAERMFNDIGESLVDCVKSQLFGKPCFKINKKAFVCFFKDCMVFKLSNGVHQEALCLDGAELFDPSGKGRPMKEWVFLPSLLILIGLAMNQRRRARKDEISA